MDLEVMTTNGYSTIPKDPGLKTQDESNILESYPGHSFEMVLPQCRDAVGVFHWPSRVYKMEYVSNLYKLLLYSWFLHW